MSYQKVFTNQYQLGEKAFVGLSSLRPPSDCSIPKNKSSEEGGEYAHVGVVHNKVKASLMSHLIFFEPDESNDHLRDSEVQFCTTKSPQFCKFEAESCRIHSRLGFILASWKFPHLMF